MRPVAMILALGLLSTPALPQYESSFGIKVIPGHQDAALPTNFAFAYDFTHGARSFAGTWKALAGGGPGDGARLECSGASQTDPASLRFSFSLPPGGDLWSVLQFLPGRYSGIDLKPGDGFFFRARARRPEMDGYPARWYLRIRVRDAEGRYHTYQTEDFEVVNLWQGYYVPVRDFGGPGRRGIFAAGDTSVRLYDVSFIPDTEKYRQGDLTLDAFAVYRPGEKRPDDADGDGLPDTVDGDHDNDGVLDFAQQGEGPLTFERRGYVQGNGRWSGTFTVNRTQLARGDTLEVQARLTVQSPVIGRAIRAIPEVVGLLCGERRYDRNGRYHAFTNHMISGLLTPTGLPIENYQTLVPTRHVRMSGVTLFTSPIDAVCRVPLSRMVKDKKGIQLDFTFRVPIDDAIPEGYYRLYFEFGVVDQAGNFLRLDALPGVALQEGLGSPDNTYGIARAENLVFEKKHVLLMVRVGQPAPPRMPWALLFDTEIHGVKGLVPEEEKSEWALNLRTRLSSRPIFPRGAYNLEPGFPSLAYQSLNVHYPLNPGSGELHVSVTRPDGTTVDLGSAPFQALTTWGATTRTGRFLHDFDQYGEYRVTMKGWILDAYGNRFQGGGTYRLWIAERITFGTFPSQPYLVGEAFLGAVEVVPALPADVTLTIEFYPDSDPERKEVFVTRGKADRLGLFVAPEHYVFRQPGEYVSRMEAQYTDARGRLWLASLRGAMIVAPPDAPLIAHGTPGYMVNGYFHDTEPRFALGKAGSAKAGKSYFVYYPYESGDVLYIPSTMDHMNSIFPLLTMSFRDGFVPYENELGTRPFYPIRPTTRNGVSPFAFPEQINRMAYYYADGWRPGVSGRHIVGTAQMMNSYWSTSPSLLGQQMHTLGKRRPARRLLPVHGRRGLPRPGYGQGPLRHVYLHGRGHGREGSEHPGSGPVPGTAAPAERTRPLPVSWAAACSRCPA